MKVRNLLLLRAATIALAGWFVFSPAIHGRFLWDDPIALTGNPELRSLAGLGKIWFSPADADYYPLKTTVQWAEWHRWGDRGEGYHLVNLALHVIGALLLWRVLAKLGVRRPWLGGLLFVVHPLTVVSVAWISELKNTLSLPFLLLAMLAWMDYDPPVAGPPPRARWVSYGWALFLFLAALLSKSSVVMFPFVLLLYARWRRGRVVWADFLAAAPFFALSLIFGCVALWFQDHRAIGADLMPMASFASRVATAGPAVWFYLFKSMVPFHPLPIYAPWHLGARSPWCGLAWAALAAVLVWLWSRRSAWGRHACLGFGFFLVNLVPVLGFAPMYYLHLARVGDQWVYLPLVGLIGLAAGISGGGPSRRAGLRLVDGRVLCALVVVALFAGESRRYAAAFASEESLWSYTLRFNPEAWLAQNNLAGILFAENRLDEARARYEQALRLRPDYPEAHNGMGNIFVRAGRPDEAVPEFEAALRLAPDYPDAHDNLGLALQSLGRIPEAIVQFNLALRARADFPVASYNLGNVLAAAGRWPDAIAAYQKTLRQRSDFPEAHHNLGVALALSGHLPEAIAQYEEALRLRPGFPEVHNDLGLALVQSGRLAEGIAHYREALRLKPDFASVHYNLGLALRAAGRPREASEQFNLAPPVLRAHF